MSPAILTLAVLAAFFMQSARHTDETYADTPHAGLSFALGLNVDGDGDNDCGTGVPMSVGNGAPDPVSVQVSNTTCEVRENGTFRANVYLMNNGGISYAGAAQHVLFAGVTSQGTGDAVWDGCVFEASASGPGFENVGCSTGLPPAGPVQHVGLMATFTLRCAADGSISLGHGPGETELYKNDKEQPHRENGPDMLTINCVEGLPEVNGDSNCDGNVNSIDAALILQNTAGLLGTIPCADGADADNNGTVNAIDAALVLQFSAGLLDEL
jgi:hypothetical protein